MKPLIALVTGFLTAAAPPATACQTALLLAFDVSNSIDSGEFRLQTAGLAAALRDPDLADALLSGQVTLSVVQWSGRGETAVILPWHSMRSHGDVETFAARAETMPRAFHGSNTAVGGLIDFGLAYLDEAADCQRRVIDISGDGQDNAGTNPPHARQRAEASGVQINGLAIEGGGQAITNYFKRHVRTRDGFVMTARGYGDYPETLRKKILREIALTLF